MHGHPVDLNAQVSELVETSLQDERVEGMPVGDQFAEPVRGRPACPGADGARRQPSCAQPSAKVLKGLAVEDRPEWLSTEWGGHAEIMTARIRPPAHRLQPS